MKRTRVLIVDDQATMRALVAETLRADPALEVVGEATNAEEARRLLGRLRPDVMTLDVEMPGMSGLDFLGWLMQRCPMPVVMVSSQTRRGAEMTMRALELGAVDCLAKPSIARPNALSELPAKLRQASEARVQARSPDSRAVAISAGSGGDIGLVAIGASTGGVEALGAILARFPSDCPPTVVVQHMPALFTASLAARLDANSRCSVVEARDGAVLARGHVYIAPGGDSHLEIRGRGVPAVRIVRGETVSGHRPSIDVMFRSAAAATGSAAVGVLLTGMGRDGADGLLAMRRRGAHTIGQDERSCVVYGMPRAAKAIGAVCQEVGLDRIAHEIFNRAAHHRAGSH